MWKKFPVAGLGGPLNQSQLQSEWPLPVPQFPQTTPGYSLLLTLVTQHRWNLQVAQRFPGAVQVSQGSDAVALQWAGAACGGAEGREGHVQVPRALNMPDCGCVHSPVLRECRTQVQGLARAGTAQRESRAPPQSCYILLSPSPRRPKTVIPSRPLTKPLTRGPRPKQQRQQWQQQQLQMCEASKPGPAHGSQGQEAPPGLGLAA